MLLREFPILLGITIVSLLVAAACTPDSAGDEGVPAQAPADGTASSPAQNGGTGEVVDVTPMSEQELAAQPTGQSEPGASASDQGSQDEDEETEQAPPREWVTYSDSTYQFSVSYPANFVFQSQPAEKLSNLQPKPEAAFTIMNPVTAASEIVELEPADLEIRVHNPGQTDSLESWLTSNGLLPAGNTAPIKPFQTAHVLGVEVCASTLIAPGCSYFILGTGWIYELRPATVEGENIMGTFMLIQ